MKAQMERISPVKIKLSVEISQEEIAADEQAAYRDLQRTANLRGFRKGKAPLAAVKSLYGARVRADLLDKLVRKSYLDALREHQVIPASDADIQLQSAADDTIAYTAVVEVQPTVEATTYRGLSLEKQRVEIAEQEVERQLEQLRANQTSFDPADADHAAADGDMVLIDFEGFVAGVAFAGGKGEGQTVVLGAGQFIPGFEDGLVGAKAGETREVTTTFPAEYKSSELAGQEATFQVQVKEVKVPTLPELDDEFAKGLGVEGGLVELRDSIREHLRREQESNVERDFRQRTIDVLLNHHPFEVPESIVADQQAHHAQRLRQDLESRGIDLAALGLDRGEFQAKQRQGAERAVRWTYLMRAIAEAEQLTVTEADVDQRIQEIAQADGRPASVIRGFFEKNDQLYGLRTSLLEQKVLERVVELGSVVETTEDHGEEETTA